MDNGSVNCTILGGGIAGLAAAHAAHERGVSVVLHEASSRLGGNAVTLSHGAFRFDAGAHRFHDRVPAVTRTVRTLLGADLRKIDAPSRIHVDGVFVDFPLSPLDLLRKLPGTKVMKASLDFVRARLRRGKACANLHDYAVRAYGHTIARTFLTNYSEKLWGVPGVRLSPVAAGKRLQGLRLKTFLLEAMHGADARTAHLDGEFYYPRGGIGRIQEVLAAGCPPGTLQTGVAITAIHHNGSRVKSIQRNKASGHDVVDRMICTLPLPTVMKLLDPPPPARILGLARALRFRHVVVVAVFLDRESVSPYASTYFPSSDFPFTRIHEPRCRCPDMAPPGTTSLVAEIPCDPGDATWCLADEPLVTLVQEGLERLGWIRSDQIREAVVHRMVDAYPVPETGAEACVQEIRAWLDRFPNLRLVGRGSLFAYHHIHDLVQLAHETVEEFFLPAGAAPGQRSA